LRSAQTLVVAGGCVCFPPGWSLSEKQDHPVAFSQQPVLGLAGFDCDRSGTNFICNSYLNLLGGKSGGALSLIVPADKASIPFHGAEGPDALQVIGDPPTTPLTTELESCGSLEAAVESAKVANAQ
jgi:hypothetical protein